MTMTKRLRMVARLNVVAWLGVVSCCGSAVAETYYVNNRVGNDRFDGLSERPIGGDNGPVRSLALALRRADKSDMIILAATGRPYYESLTLMGPRHSGTGQHPFQIVGNGAELSGARPLPADQWQPVADSVWRITPIRKGHYQLVENGAALPEVACERTAAALPELRVGNWCAWRGAIYFRTEKEASPRDMDLSIAEDGVGLTLLGIENVIITNLTLKHYRLDGINAHDRCREVVLDQITSTENGRSGITVAGSSRVAIFDSACRANRKSSLLITELGIADVEDCDFDAEPTVVPQVRE